MTKICITKTTNTTLTKGTYYFSGDKLVRPFSSPFYLTDLVQVRRLDIAEPHQQGLLKTILFTWAGNKLAGQPGALIGAFRQTKRIILFQLLLRNNGQAIGETDSDGWRALLTACPPQQS